MITEKRSFYYSLIVLISMLTYSVIFISPDFLGINDFDFNFTNMIIASKSVFHFVEFPLWNPYDHGGTPLLAQPYSSSLSPFQILNVLFDPILALKIKILLYIIFSGIFSFIFILEKTQDERSALLGSIIFTFSSYFSLNIAQGQYEFLSAAYIPLLFLSYAKSDLRSRFIFALSFALMFFEGGVYNIVISCFCLVFLLLFNRLKSIKHFFINLIFGLAVSAVKFIPALELMSSQNRKIYDISGFSVWSLIHALINRDQFVSYNTNMEPFFEYISKYIGLDQSFGFINGIDSRWDEYGFYVGILSLFLVAIAVVITVIKKKHLALLALLIFTAVLSFGFRLPYSPWNLLSHLPLFENMRHPTRFRVVILLLLSVYAAVGYKNIIKLVEDKFQNVKWNLISVLIITIMSLDFIDLNQSILSDAFVYPPFSKMKPEKEFSYIEKWQNDPYYLITTEEGYYPAFLENKGLVYKKETQELNIATKSISSSNYRGEAYHKDKNSKVEILSRSHNSIILNLKNDNQSNDIIINQNYYSGWKSDHCDIESYKGLLKLSKCQGHVVKISYSPTSFYIGLFISIIAFFYLLKGLLNSIDIIDMKRLSLKFWQKIK